MTKRNHNDTDTSKWTLAVHRVTAKSIEIWVGTLFPTMKKPDRARVRLLSSKDLVKTQYIERAEWKRPFRSHGRRFYSVVKFTDLTPGSSFRLAFDRRIEAVERAGIMEEWQNLRRGVAETLPSRLPLEGRRPFTVAIGSCFYSDRDGGQASEAYAALYDRGDPSNKPHMSILTGDQVYLDIGFDSLSFIGHEIRQRIADDYALHWQLLSGILNRGGTWMLPDDHEYWNDYPFYTTPIPQLQALRLPHVRKAWTKASVDGVRRVQRAPRLETIDLGGDLSICMADLRSHRSDDHFLPAGAFRDLVRWAEGLTAPGVLAIPQPVIVRENKQERNLRSYPAQYARLLEALAKSGHDVVVLSGDVHFGRIASTRMRSGGGRLIEIISSPLSNLTYLNGIATSKSVHRPKQFPPSRVSVPGWAAGDVEYSEHFDVTTKRGFPVSPYPKERTREHFMTIGFSRTTGGKIRLVCKAWRIRSTGRKGVPTRDFPRPFRTTLT